MKKIHVSTRACEVFQILLVIAIITLCIALSL